MDDLVLPPFQKTPHVSYRKARTQPSARHISCTETEMTWQGITGDPVYAVGKSTIYG